VEISVLLYDSRAVRFWRETVIVPQGRDIYAYLWDRFGSLTVEYAHVNS